MGALARRILRRLFFERVRRSLLHAVKKIADFALILRKDSFQHRTTRSRSERNQYLLVDVGSGGDDMRLLLQTFHQRTPIANTVSERAQKIYVRSRTKQAVLQ